LNTLNAIEELKIRAVEKGGPIPKHAAMIANCKEFNNPYGLPHNQRSAWLPDEVKPLPKTADVVYFTGCTSSYRRQEIASATAKLLKRTGLDFTVLGEGEHCCGGTFLRSGNVEFGKEMMSHNLEQLKNIKAKTVIFSCPECYRTFLEVEKYDLERTFECQSVAEYLQPILPKLKFKKMEKKLTYHDPCELGRNLEEPVFEPPREILKAIPGVELVEMQRNRELAFCCGAGGGVMAAYPEFAAKTARRRLEEVVDVKDGAGVTTLASSCPICKENFLRAAREFNVEVKDITEIVLEALT
jgi:Fe-S oxidoreductase